MLEQQQGVRFESGTTLWEKLWAIVVFVPVLTVVVLLIMAHWATLIGIVFIIILVLVRIPYKVIIESEHLKVRYLHIEQEYQLSKIKHAYLSKQVFMSTTLILKLKSNKKIPFGLGKHRGEDILEYLKSRKVRIL